MKFKADELGVRIELNFQNLLTINSQIDDVNRNENDKCIIKLDE